VKKEKKIEPLDLKEWNDFTKNPKDIFDKEKNKNIISKQINQYKFDLHGFSLQEANIKVKEIIVSCVEKKYNEILLVTGKGLHSQTDSDSYVSKDLSKLRYSIPDFILNDNHLSELVLSINSASKEKGGEGAIVIKLKKL
jgi:DNA-nicking Smr family endonuclease